MDAAALALHLVEAHNTRDDTGLLTSYAPEATVRFAGRPEPVAAATWVAAQAAIRASFPDLRFEIRSVGTGPKHVVVELTMTGTNDGPLHLGDSDRIVLRTDAAVLPATGRRFRVDGVVVLEVFAGLVTAERHYWPDVEFLVQLGLVARRPAAEPVATG
jgi:ketosteroid isomerase-like protein